MNVGGGPPVTVEVPSTSSTPVQEDQLESFALGERFKTFKEVEAKLRRYEQSKFMKFWKRDSRTVEAARKRVSRYLSDEIVYYEVNFCCIHGGRKFKASGEGLRSTLTFRKDCPMHLVLRASEDGSALVVKTFVEEHNHILSKELFRRLPHERKLSDSEEHEAQKLLGLQANKKIIQDKLVNDTGKVILLRDLTNIAKKMKSSKTRNDLQECVKRLTETYGACVEFITSENSVFHGIFFQDQEMKHVFSSYPEILFIDATYKLLELRFPVYVLLVEDGNGQSELASVFLLLEETELSISAMVNAFKKYNDNWEVVRVIMADKDMTEREVFASAFPHADLLICLYHTFRSFRREIVTEKMGITSGERSMCLDILQRMAYAKTDEEYQGIVSHFKECAPLTVKEYFAENWEPIHKQWVMGMKFSSGNFLNNTNNRLESINQKLKSVIPRYSSLEEFIEKFFLILRVLRSEREHKAALTVQKVPVVFHSTTSEDSINYMKYLTPYAYQFVAKQISLASKVKVCRDGDTLQVSSSEGVLDVTETSCNCGSWLSMRLPCRHIFAIRSEMKLDYYAEELCDKRWSMDYYRESQRIFCDTDMDDENLTSVEIVDLPAPKTKILSQSEKFRRASKITTKLASLASEATGKGYKSRIALLESIVSNWESNKEISLRAGQSCVASEDELDEMDLGDDDEEPRSELMHLLTEEQKVELAKRKSRIESAPSSSLQPTVSSLRGCSPVLVTESHHEEQEQSSTDNGNDTLKNIMMPPTVRKRGRPKGHEVTVIGLPAKRSKRKNPCDYKEKVLPFIKLHSSVKERAMLKWFVGERVASEAQKNKVLIEETQVEVRPELLPDALLDENVDVNLVRRFFSADAWLVIKDVCLRKKANPVYVCKLCSHDVHESPSLACDHCLSWFHIKCVGLKKGPKIKYWFCRDCHASPMT